MSQTPQNLVVITHRRSGTHLTIDSIRNNFSVFRQNEHLVFETLNPAHPDAMSLEEMRKRVRKGGHVIKTHHRSDEGDEMPDEHRQFLFELLDQSALIYVVRSGMDVMVSLYEFRRRHDPSIRDQTFSEFLRSGTFDPGKPKLNKMEYWADHVRGWEHSRWRERLLFIRFEDWINHYRKTLKTVAGHLAIRSDWRRRDVRMGHPRQRDGIIRTWVEPRKGVIGDHVNYFSTADTERFWEHCGDVMRRFGYRGCLAASST